MYVTLHDFLNFLVSPDGGSFMLIAAFVSLFVERFDWWHSLDKTVKVVVMVVVSALVGIAANALLQSPELVAKIEPVYKAFAYSVLAYLANQGTHTLDRISRIVKPTG